jgi:Histidine kinase/Tetratricopeptide repeat
MYFISIKKYFVLFGLLLGSCLLMAQKEGYTDFKRGQQKSATELIQEAKAIKHKEPTQAIKLVDEAISLLRQNKDKKKSRGSSAEEADAFVLLGSIYEQINQQELALERYRQALLLVDKKAPQQKADILERMGYLYLALGNGTAAEKAYQDCINSSNNKTLTLRCEEGLADVKLFKQDAAGLDAQLESIESNYQLDSVVLAKNEARRAQNYAQQNDYDRAASSFQNSVNILPDNNKLSKEEAAPFEQAKQKILSNEKADAQDEIDIRSSVNTKASFSNEALVLENLKIAELYESEKNYSVAEKYVVAAKDLIDANTDAGVAADVFKMSSELQQRKGKTELALNDLEKYIEAKENAILRLEEDLKEQVEIVKGQQQIDIQQLDYDLEEKDRELLASRLRTQQIITGLLSLVLLASVVYFYFLYKNVKEKRKANQLLLLKSLRAQMNPHFIFNALNSVNNFIAKNDEKAANKFLSDFSTLMRKVLDYSQKDFITLEEELELNELYLKLEHFRFRDKFDYTFDNQLGHQYEHLPVPPMFIQPFIENAIWHGLRYKESKGKLLVSIQKQAEFLLVQIKDDGIGRERSKALKTENQKKYKSTGIENVSRSMALINDIYGKQYEVLVSDVPASEGTGTVVNIRIPIAG